MADASAGDRSSPVPARILPAIIFSQFAGTSLWFAANAVLPDLQSLWGLSPDAVGYVTSSVQLGFIVGTLTFAFLAVSDIFSPRLIFLLCSLLGASFCASIHLFAEGLASLVAFRFLTGFFLAGIYPVGMKIAAGWYRADLGKALGFLVGALVLGTAFPHVLNATHHDLPWSGVIMAVSAIAALGGVVMYALVPDGPHLSRGTRFDPRALGVIFRSKAFRASAFGYFGHMWELYAFWAFVPVLLSAYDAVDGPGDLNVPLWSFAVIGIGFFGCAGGGLLTGRFGSATVAVAQLAVSGICCLLSPLVFSAPAPVFLGFLLLWGLTVVGDSPQFSTLNARYAPSQLVGSALTIATCVGFAITVVSIQLLSYAIHLVDARWIFLLLAAGPAFGLLSMRPILSSAGEPD